MESLLFEALVILFLIIINGFFSSAEIAIISAKRSEIDRLAGEGNHSAKLVAEMKEKPENFLATVQIGVTVVSTLASVIGGVAAAQHLNPIFSSIPFGPVQSLAEILSIGMVVAVIAYVSLVIGELAPKSIALRHSERIACFSARPLALLSRISFLVIKLLTTSTRTVLKLFGIKDTEKRSFVSEEELKYYIREGEETGVFEETEAELLHGIFEFSDTTVKEVMVAKPDVSAIDIATPAKEALRHITEHGFSRYPVYRDTPETIIGVLFNKDIFRALEAGTEIVLADLIRKPYFIPNSIMISRLLRELQKRKVHMAIVVDEHGDIDGVVTIEDILEEIVGEIEDEYDAGRDDLVEKLDDGTMVIDASASIRDLEDFGILIGEEEADEYHTLAGFMLAKLQRIPRGGEFVGYKDKRYTVVDIEANRIVKVKVEPIFGKGKGGPTDKEPDVKEPTTTQVGQA